MTQTLFPTTQNCTIGTYAPMPILQRELSQMDYWELWAQHVLAEGNTERTTVIEGYISKLPIEAKNQLKKLNRFKGKNI